MKKYIKGNVRKTLFESENGYKVGLFKVKESNDEELEDFVDKTITFTGTFMPLNTEVSYVFYGKLITHPRYGIQYIVESYDVCAPTDLDGIIMYLSSGLFKGIGKKTAKNIVDVFKEDTINEIKNGNQRLYYIKGLNERKVYSLIDKMKELDKYQDLIISLNTYGLSTQESLTILTKYKEKIVDILKSNVYLLQSDIDFLKLDKIFLRDNSETDDIRIKAIIKYLIKQLCYKTGDTLVLKEDLYLNLRNFFSNIIEIDNFERQLKELEENEELVIINEKLSLKEFYETEFFIAKRINDLNKIRTNIKVDKIKGLIKNYENINNISLNKDQKNAIESSIKNNLCIITGGPGTGKTTIIKAICEVYLSLNDNSSGEDIALLAPTGRSAKRMAESVHRASSTIHKFLKWNKEDESFQVNETNKSSVKLVIIDEASMIDIFLFRSLLEGLRENVKIILVGDSNQLPSISPGNMLYDLLNVEKLSKIFLKIIYRAKEDSFIITFANEIKNKIIFKKFDKYADFSFIESEDRDIKKYLIALCEKAKVKELTVDNFQVLAPMYKGEVGIDNLNILMQSIFNPENKELNEIKIRETIYREKDKVIQLVNDVDNNIFNGDIGYIKRIINTKNPIIEIDYMGNVVAYKKNKFDEFKHAFAISVHKSQGSEYDNVVLVLASSFKRMLYNKLVYTGASRAKKSLIVIGKIDNLNYAITKEYSENRLTSLSSMF